MAEQEIKTPEAPKISPFMRNMLKGLIPVVSSSLPQVNGFLVKYLSEIPLENEEDRICVVCMTASDGSAYFVTVALSGNTITRTINRVSAVEFIQTLIKNA